MRAETPCTLDLANSFEAKSIPDFQRRDVGFVDQVEDGVCVALIEMAH